MMQLLQFRVTDFRSVKDSGWIGCHDVSTLVGSNEAGKTNLLLPLWKLHPAKGGEIHPLADYPRRRYNEFRRLEPQPIFIQAYFQLSDALCQRLEPLASAPPIALRRLWVARRYDGSYVLRFVPDGPLWLEYITEHQQQLSLTSTELEAQSLAALADIQVLEPEDAQQLATLVENWQTLLADANIPSLQVNMTEALQQAVLEALPRFVYYSNYGNLDSEIYLPHVIDNLQRSDLSAQSEAKIRTLRVLFEFVKLDPREILELGRDTLSDTLGDTSSSGLDDSTRHNAAHVTAAAQLSNLPWWRKLLAPWQGQPPAAPTANQSPAQSPAARRVIGEASISAVAEKKKEREILLQSASFDLSSRFAEWWQQGEYSFRLQADGNHLRIWVRDSQRPEEIELEQRSTGLQWFLSFYLIFLVESAGSEQSSILLLDEAGLSLHALAQQDLARFFDRLAVQHQIVHSTHLPFMLSSSRLDRVSVVYVGDDGSSHVSSNLQRNKRQLRQSKSRFTVQAALGLTISDTMLHGCQPIIVPGDVEQWYLSSIKTLLVGQGLLQPARELLFFPVDNAPGIAALTYAIAEDNPRSLEESSAPPALPWVLLGGDAAQQQVAEQLQQGLYHEQPDKLLRLEHYCPRPIQGDFSIEALLPEALLIALITRYLRGPEEDFSELVVTGQALPAQVSRYANRYRLPLANDWRIAIAQRAKSKLLSGDVRLDRLYLERWQQLFVPLTAQDLPLEPKTS